MSNYNIILGHLPPNSIGTPFGIPISGKKDQIIIHTKYNETTNRLYGIGKSNYGELGKVDVCGYDIVNVQDNNVYGFSSYLNSGISLIAGGENHHVFVYPTINSTTGIKEDKVFAWGTNNKYQLGKSILDLNGNNKLLKQLGPSKVDISFVFTDDDIVRTIDCGYNHTHVVTNSNKLFSWGYNYYGQLGITDGIMISTMGIMPQQINLDLCGESIHKVYGGNNHSVVLTKMGNVYCYGNNDKCQLGISNSILYSHKPIKVSSLYDIIDIAVGEDFTVAIKNDNTVWGWGNDSHGQVSKNSDIVPTRFVITPILIDTMIVHASCGKNHCLLLKRNSTIVGYGDNTYYQISSIPDDKNLLVYAANNNSFFVNYNKSLYGYGEGISGSLLLGKTTDTTDTPINLIDDKHIDINFDYTYFHGFLVYNYDLQIAPVIRNTLFNDEDVIPSSSEYINNRKSIGLLTNIESQTNSSRSTTQKCIEVDNSRIVRNISFKSYRDRLNFQKSLSLTNSSCLIYKD